MALFRTLFVYRDREKKGMETRVDSLYLGRVEAVNMEEAALYANRELADSGYELLGIAPDTTCKDGHGLALKSVAPVPAPVVELGGALKLSDITGK